MTPAKPEAAPQVASKPPEAAASSASANEKPASINFEPKSSDLSTQDMADLAKLAGMLKQNREMRVQLVAYPASEPTESDARARSFTRALAVRSYLVGQGVSAERIDVRLQINKPSEGSTDRIDPVLLPKSPS